MRGVISFFHPFGFENRDNVPLIKKGPFSPIAPICHFLLKILTIYNSHYLLFSNYFPVFGNIESMFGSR